jgi:gliding motility-associated-like protein
MKKYILPLIIFCFITSTTDIYAQAFRDGNMQVRYRMDQHYADCGTGEIDAEDFVTNYRMRDYPDIDGTNWQYSGPIAWTGPFSVCIGCCTYTNSANHNRTFTYGAPNTLGPRPAPAGIQFGFESWEDDYFSCAGGFICFGSCGPGASDRTVYNVGGSCGCISCNDDDDYASREQNGTISNNFRIAAPNTFTNRGTMRDDNPGFTGTGSTSNGINYGAIYSSFWTPPCPDTFWADRPVICDPGYVTLQTGGAVFGGTYRWYQMVSGSPVFIQETTDSFLTLYVAATTTYRVFTKNVVSPSAPAGTQAESWSYRQFTIFQEKPTITAINTANPLCADSSNGSISIRVASSVPCQFSINNGVTWQTDSNFINLPRGLYLVKVKSAFCEVPPYGLPVQLLDPTRLTSYIGRTDSVRCNGNNDGAIELSVSGGTGPYTFVWSNGATSEDIVSLAPGTYTVTITDNNGCVNRTTSATIYQPAPLSATTSTDSVSCAGSADGMASTSVSGGNGAYSYLWNNGANTASISSLSGGTYIVTVTDRKGCTLARSMNVYEAPALTVSLSKTDVDCYGANTGSVSVDTNSIGGVGPYSYTWSPPATNTPTISGLGVGTYSVVVSDSRGCTTTGSITVNQPDSLRISSLLFDVECNGGANGRIDITVSGGSTPYIYAWTGGITSSSEDISGLSGGTYDLMVMDNQGCMKMQSFTINEPAPLATTFTNINARCFGESSASSTVNITGGTSPYNILWNTFATSATISGINAGTYTVIITDDNGCIHNNTTTITQPSQMILSNIGITNNRCYGFDSGTVFFSVLGGMGTLDYVWNTGLPFTNNHPNLGAGLYNVVITDDSGCFVIENFTITEPTAFITNINGNSPTCNDNSTGFAVVTALGSTPPYNYTWNTSPPQSGIMATNLGAGTYTVTITDLNSCTVSDTVTITAPAPINVTTVPLSVKCFGASDGKVTVSATGGTMPYKYILNGILQTDSMFTGLTAGNYIIVVEDNNDCVGNTTFSIAQPSNYSMNPTATPAVIQRGMTTQLNANITSPLPIVSVAWNAYPSGNPLDFSACGVASNCQTPTASPIENTTYEIISTDSNSCVLVDSISVVVLQEKAVFIPTAFSPNGDGKNETFDFQILGAKEVAVSIWNRWGEIVYTNPAQINGAGNGWDGKSKGQNVSLDTYVYQFEVEYYDGTKETLSGTVNVLK